MLLILSMSLDVFLNSKVVWKGIDESFQVKFHFIVR